MSTGKLRSKKIKNGVDYDVLIIFQEESDTIVPISFLLKTFSINTFSFERGSNEILFEEKREALRKKNER